jgi:hypothetical protein
MIVMNEIIFVTERQILFIYWRYWSTQMLRVGKSPMITEKNCINDFIVVNWATEIESKCQTT